MRGDIKMTNKTIRTNQCVGCNREFVVLNIEESKDLYCSELCKSRHSIFLDENNYNIPSREETGGSNDGRYI